MVLGGQGVDLQGPRGSRGMPTGSQGVKGLAYRVPGGQICHMCHVCHICHICHTWYPPSNFECLSHQDSENRAHQHCSSNSIGVFVFVLVFVILSEFG